MHHEPGGQALFGRSASLVYRSSPKLLRWRLALFRPAWLLRWSLQWRQLWPLLDADADRVDLESRLIELLLEDRARVSVCQQRRLMARSGRSLSWCKAWGYESHVHCGGSCSAIGLRKELVGTQLAFAKHAADHLRSRASRSLDAERGSDGKPIHIYVRPLRVNRVVLTVGQPLPICLD
jgi:hypothetical protein